MREIEFRGKRIDNGEWVYGYLIVDEISDKYYIFSKGNSCNETDRIGEEGLLHILTFEVITETIGQYTGLKDKNGKKIFEGDIVAIEYQRACKRGKALIEYMDKYASFVLTNTGTIANEYEALGDYQMQYIEVIGNIYDNPELLEESENK